MRFGGKEFQGFFRRSGRHNMASWQGPSSYNTENRQTWAPLEKLPVVYSCVKAIIDPLQSYPRRVLDYAGNPIMAPPWVESPNSLMTGGDFVAASAISLLLDGNCYWFPEYRGGRLMSIAIANPHTVDEYTHGGKIVWYVNGQRTDMKFVHLRAMSYPGRIEGIKKTDPLKISAEISLEALRYIQQFMLRGVALQVLFKGPTRLTESPQGRKNIQQIMDDMHRGWRKAFRSMILPAGLEVEFIDHKMLSDLSGWTDLRAVTDSEIAASFGLDPEEINVTVKESSLTYKNEPSRRARKYENAVKPIATVIEAGLTSLLPDGQTFDLDQHDSLYGGPHDRANLVAQVSLAEKHSGQALLSTQEKRELLGFTGPGPQTMIDTGGGNNNE